MMTEKTGELYSWDAIVIAPADDRGNPARWIFPTDLEDVWDAAEDVAQGRALFGIDRDGAFVPVSPEMIMPGKPPIDYQSRGDAATDAGDDGFTAALVCDQCGRLLVELSTQRALAEDLLDVPVVCPECGQKIVRINGELLLDRVSIASVE